MTQKLEIPLNAKQAKVVGLHYGNLLIETGSKWSADKIPRLGAALAFYSILSLGHLMLLLFAGIGLIYGSDAARTHILNLSSGMIGEQGGTVVQEILQHATPVGKGWTTIIGVCTLLFGASGVFGELQEAFNIVWNVRIKSGAIKQLILSRLLSFSMVIGTALMLLTSLLASAALTAVITYTSDLLPLLKGALHLVDTLFSLCVSAAMFGLVFKYVPDIRIGWRDVWQSALMTAILFTIGKSLIGFYLGHSGVSSSYGAAGSIVVLLIWIYYVSQILLFGAEFCQVSYRSKGGETIPARHAELRNAPEA